MTRPLPNHYPYPNFALFPTYPACSCCGQAGPTTADPGLDEPVYPIQEIDMCINETMTFDAHTCQNLDTMTLRPSVLVPRFARRLSVTICD